MNIITLEKELKTNNFKPITSNFDAIFVATSDEFEDNNDFFLTEKNIKKLFNVINFSWDGEIYLFNNKDRTIVMNLLKEWFSNPENHSEIDDICLANCLLIKNTKNGFAIIDTQTDMSSTFNSFLNYLSQKNPDINYDYFSDCHLIDNINLGRSSIMESIENLFLFCREGVFEESCLLSGFGNISFDNKTSLCFEIIPKDKEIVVTGSFPFNISEIKDSLKNSGYVFSTKLNDNSWLWIGNNPDENKINEAISLNLKLSTISDITENMFQNYLKNKNNLSKKIKP